jgi:hypothetical protein
LREASRAASLHHAMSAFGCCAMDLHHLRLRQRGQVFGISGLIVALLSAFVWLPLNLGATGLSIGLSVVAILHGERVYALITPVLVGAGLLILSAFALGMIWGLAKHGNPGPLLLVLAFPAAPFVAIAYDNAQRGGALSPAGAKPRITPFEGQHLASRLRSGSTRTRPQLSLTPQPAGPRFNLDCEDVVRCRFITLGRMRSSDVVLRDKSVSRSACTDRRRTRAWDRHLRCWFGQRYICRRPAHRRALCPTGRC